MRDFLSLARATLARPCRRSAGSSSMSRLRRTGVKDLRDDVLVDFLADFFLDGLLPLSQIASQPLRYSGVLCWKNSRSGFPENRQRIRGLTYRHHPICSSLKRSYQARPCPTRFRTRTCSYLVCFWPRCCRQLWLIRTSFWYRSSLSLNCRRNQGLRPTGYTKVTGNSRSLLGPLR